MKFSAVLNPIYYGIIIELTDQFAYLFFSQIVKFHILICHDVIGDSM